MYNYSLLLLFYIVVIFLYWQLLSIVIICGWIRNVYANNQNVFFCAKCIIFPSLEYGLWVNRDIITGFRPFSLVDPSGFRQDVKHTIYRITWRRLHYCLLMFIFNGRHCGFIRINYVIWITFGTAVAFSTRNSEKRSLSHSTTCAAYTNRQ